MAGKSTGLGSLEKWDIATTSKFLKLYRNNKCLWDFSDQSYKDKIQRNSAVENIAREMNLPGFDNRYVVLKIRALRSTYIYERRKVRQRLRQGEKFQTHLGWYHLADSFLRKYVVEKNTSNSEDSKIELPPPMSFDDCIESPESSTVQTQHSTAKDELMEFLTTNNDSKKLNVNRNSPLELEFSIQADCNDEIEVLHENFIEEKPKMIMESSSNNSVNLKRKKSKNFSCYVPKASSTIISDDLSNLQQHTESLQVQQTPQISLVHSDVNLYAVGGKDKTTTTKNMADDDDDEFEIFAKSISSQLRKLPREDAYVLQTQLQFLLSQAKLKAMGIQGSFCGLDNTNFFNFNVNK